MEDNQKMEEKQHMEETRKTEGKRKTGKLGKIAWAAATALLLWLCISVLGYIVRPTDTDYAYSQVETFHSLPENSVEVMIYGSSHAFRGVSTMEMYRQYGIGAYNYGWHYQKLNTTNLFLKDSLEKQTPRIALIEAFLVDTVLHDTNITAEIYYSRYIHNRAARWQYLKQCFGNDPERYLSFYMPLCAFHDNWNTLTAQSFQALEISPFYRMSMGFAGSVEVKEVEIPDWRTFEQKPLGQDSIQELKDIVATCRDKGIRVIFFTVPWEGEYCYSDAMRKFSEENGCEYLDFFELAEEIGLDGTADFADVGHLNTRGAEKVADYMGQYLVEHYDLTDMRTVENNLWAVADAL